MHASLIRLDDLPVQDLDFPFHGHSHEKKRLLNSIATEARPMGGGIPKAE
jgi:hypothetical protein